jgi:hypothetical protein
MGATVVEVLCLYLPHRVLYYVTHLRPAPLIIVFLIVPGFQGTVYPPPSGRGRSRS